MKQLIRRQLVSRMMIAGAAFVGACQSKSGKVQAFIDGVYVNRARSEFAIADDTLGFTQADGTHYYITRRTGYQAIRNGKLLPKKFKLEKVEGDYDPNTRLLNETTTGRVFYFDPESGMLRLKQAVYRRIN
ncbi:hypothetical protein [Mucilaginibacter rubeus]|uniref:Lipoprotein n=1 Tax=Mucilaginibacter rubeus TaxID=2027860 RepID=A0A5C1HUB8_9SPHI|nr:hypothetical protein [Mucilaginibacter rubeus]QEM09179.1 hypothetical protein DEO27_003815 [Mucilaginibacter rubeus]